MKESAIYQEILQEGEQRGLLKGEQRGLLKREQRGFLNGKLGRGSIEGSTVRENKSG